MGENPIVQVINDETGYLAVPGNSLGLGASFILEEIKINLSGDVTRGTYVLRNAVLFRASLE